MGREMWDARYAQIEFAYGTEPNDFVREMAARIPEGPVLCLGAGQGRNAVHLARMGYEVTALDQSPVGLMRAWEMARAFGVQIQTICADVADHEIEAQTWAGIVSVFFHLPPDLRKRVHRQVVDGLRPGGVFVLEAYTPQQATLKTGGPPNDELFYSLEGLWEDLDGLEFDHGAELERTLAEGRFHRGTSAVVQVVARKPWRPR